MRKSVKKFAIVFLALVMVLAVFAGCGGDFSSKPLDGYSSSGEVIMMIFKRISSSIWMNYTHKLMQEMLVMAIRKKWLMMICFMVLSKVLYCNSLS